MQLECKDARRRPGRLRLLVGLLITVVVVLVDGVRSDGRWKAARLHGQRCENWGYTQFSAAAGRGVPVTSSTFPADAADFDQYKCVVLPITQVPFSTPQKAALDAYMNRGGTVVALAEHLNADQTQTKGPATVTTFNNLASSYGIQALNTTVNQGPTTTFDVIDYSSSAPDWTKDVANVGYGGTTTLTVTAPAVALVRTVQMNITDPAPAPFIALRQLGAGKFVYSGDSNVFSDEGGGSYAFHDNGKLAKNVCGDISPPVITISVPIDGGRYHKDQVAPAAWTCTDPDSDVNTALTVATKQVGQAIDTTTNGAETVTKTFTVSCTDNAGNTATKTVSYIVDGRPPVVTIATPVNAATYDRGSVVPADWGCTDPDGPTDIVLPITATKQAGESIDTLLPGGGAPIQKSFTRHVLRPVRELRHEDRAVHGRRSESACRGDHLTGDGARFTIDKAVNAAWTCTDPDGAQDIDTDENKTFGTVPVGSPIDTSGTLGQTIAKAVQRDVHGPRGERRDQAGDVLRRRQSAGRDDRRADRRRHVPARVLAARDLGVHRSRW